MYILCVALDSTKYSSRVHSISLHVSRSNLSLCMFVVHPSRLILYERDFGEVITADTTVQFSSTTIDTTPMRYEENHTWSHGRSISLSILVNDREQEIALYFK